MNFLHIREESFANIITYRIFYLAHQIGIINSAFLNNVHYFINHQPPAYRLALGLLKTSHISSWIHSKTTTLIDQEDANKWIEKAEVLLNDCHTGCREKMTDEFAEWERRQRYPWS